MKSVSDNKAARFLKYFAHAYTQIDMCTYRVVYTHIYFNIFFDNIYLKH